MAPDCGIHNAGTEANGHYDGHLSLLLVCLTWSEEYLWSAVLHGPRQASGLLYRENHVPESGKPEGSEVATMIISKLISGSREADIQFFGSD